jgi:hypothetical protein
VSRPGTFEPGHELSLSHGVWSERVTDPVVRALANALLEARPDLVRFPAPVYTWALAEARLLTITAAINEQGIADGKRKPRSTWLDLEARYVRLAREARADLGLSPKSEADLAKARIEAQSATFNLEAVIAAGRKVIDTKATESQPSIPGCGPQALSPGNGNGAAPEHAERAS